MRSLTLILVIALCALNAQTQVVGYVFDEDNGQPLVGAHVMWTSGSSFGSVTDENGYFNLGIEENSDNAKVLVSFMGYEEIVVPYNPNNTEPIQIRLKSKYTSMQTVVVRAQPVISEDFAIEKMNKLDIYTNPNSRADPLRAVNSLAASTNNDETANISLRGSPPGETGIFFNNVPIEDAFRLDQANGVGQFSVFNTSIISKVNVYPSNPPLEYGAASSGMVALYTDNQLAARTRGINLHFAGMGINASDMLGDKASIAGYLNYGNGLGLKTFNAKAFERIESFNSIDAGLHFVYMLNETARLKVFNYSLSESYDYKFRHPSYEGTFAQEKKRNLSIINFQKNWSTLVLNINQGINFSDATYGTGNVETAIKQKDFFTGMNLSQSFGKLSTKTGYALDIHQLDVEGSYPIYSHALSPNHPSESYSDDNTYVIPESFVFAKYRITEDLFVAAATRRSYKTEEVPKYRSYQANLNYQINKRNRLQLAAGKYHKFQLPDASFDQAAVIQSKHISLDYQHKREKFNVQTAVYVKETNYQDRKNPIVGAELFMEYDYRRLNTSLSLARIESEIEEEGARYPSTHNFDMFARFICKYKWIDWFDLGAIFIHRDGRYYQPVVSSSFHEATQTYVPTFAPQAFGQNLKDYQVLDLNVSRIFGLGQGSMIVFLSASNLLNRENQSAPLYDQEYQANGFETFNQRVFFAGCVYNW